MVDQPDLGGPNLDKYASTKPDIDRSDTDKSAIGWSYIDYG